MTTNPGSNDPIATTFRLTDWLETNLSAEMAGAILAQPVLLSFRKNRYTGDSVQKARCKTKSSSFNR